MDYERIAQIIEEVRPLDEYQVYYLKEAVQLERVGPLVPDIKGILGNVFRQSRRVLDIGCGNGRTLLENAGLFEWGVGVDESVEHMLALANAEREAKGIGNVEFRYGKAITLPFEKATFDLVFSERGPLGHHDGTFIEALRVLMKRGWIVIETGGDFETLKSEKERFERLGVEVQLAGVFTEKLVFPDCYEFFRHYCVSWTSFEAARTMDPRDRELIDKILAEAIDDEGKLSYGWSRILIGGQKKV